MLHKWVESEKQDFWDKHSNKKAVYIASLFIKMPRLLFSDFHLSRTRATWRLQRQVECRMAQQRQEKGPQPLLT